MKPSTGAVWLVAAWACSAQVEAPAGEASSALVAQKPARPGLGGPALQARLPAPAVEPSAEPLGLLVVRDGTTTDAPVPPGVRTIPTLRPLLDLLDGAGSVSFKA